MTESFIKVCGHYTASGEHVEITVRNLTEEPLFGLAIVDENGIVPSHPRDVYELSPYSDCGLQVPSRYVSTSLKVAFRNELGHVTEHNIAWNHPYARSA